MSSGSDDILITVRIVGDGSVGGATPPIIPEPPPLPDPGGGGGGGGTQPGGGGTGSARDRWWWLNLIPGTGTRVRETGRMMNRLGVSPTGAAMGVGAALGALAITARMLTSTYRRHMQAIDALTQRYAASPALQALEDISALRVQLARIQRGQEMAPRIAGRIERRTQTQIAFEDAMATINEGMLNLTGPAMQDLMETVRLAAQLIQEWLGDPVGRARLQAIGQLLWQNFGGEAGAKLVNAVLRWLTRDEASAAENRAAEEFENLLWVLSPDNPSNQPGPGPRATFGDVPPRPAEENI